MVPVALVILWRRWTEAEAPAVRPSPWGWAALGVVLVLRAFFYEYGYEWSETATLLPAVACLTLAAGGWPLLRTVLAGDRVPRLPVPPAHEHQRHPVAAAPAAGDPGYLRAPESSGSVGR